jgi:hypothetical protein
MSHKKKTRKQGNPGNHTQPVTPAGQAPSVGAGSVTDRVATVVASAPVFKSLRNPKTRAALLARYQAFAGLGDAANLGADQAAEVLVAVYDILEAMGGAPFVAWIESVDIDIQEQAMFALFEGAVEGLGKG